MSSIFFTALPGMRMVASRSARKRGHERRMVCNSGDFGPTPKVSQSDAKPLARYIVAGPSGVVPSRAYNS